MASFNYTVTDSIDSKTASVKAGVNATNDFTIAINDFVAIAINQNITVILKIQDR